VVTVTPTSTQLIAVTLALASTVLHVRAKYRGPRWLVYVCKPLTVALLLAIAALGAGTESRYRAAVVIGLACSLLGDVLLMLPRDRFAAGLASFLAAHLAYLVAFTADVPAGGVPWVGIVYAVGAGSVLRVLWPRLGKLRLPVALYVGVIVLMAWQAAARGWTLATPAAIAAGVGALLFAVSDTLLALNRFHRPFTSGPGLVTVTYVAGQLLIALSVG
jgi:uncharacterized membrane protein YhhN